MCHITSGKVKMSILLIWAGQDGEDIYDNFNLLPHQANDVDFVLQHFEEFYEPICNFRAARFKFTKVSQHQGENIDTFYNRILKLAHQCDFSDIQEHLINAIIFGTTCVKAQDKLLQTPKTLSLQQYLIVCRHYENLRLHIQQIQPGPDKHIEILCKHHPKSKKSGQNKLQSKGQRQHPQNQSQFFQPQKAIKSQKKCYGCGDDFHRDHARNCPAWGSTCRKCNKSNHWEIVCDQVPPRRQNQNRSRQSGESQSLVNEVRNLMSTS